jgi:ABC-type glycerol-3-phosphate transport system substrate-binding protein
MPLAAVAAATACRAGQGPAGSPQPTQGKLTGTFELWQPWPIDQPTHGGPVGWKQLMDAYNAKGGPKVDIVTPPGPEGFNAKLLSAFAAGTPPDCYQVDGPGVPVFAGKGLAESLNDLMARDKWDKSQLFAFSLDIME